ncbi:MAG TPA: T9SS type A sorting domain-containing protein, partial [Niabella sp.]|nr:T9SS type A sorting domain-containing protein [Niabella sp.]
FTADYYTGTVWVLQRDGNGNVTMVNTQPGLKGGISSISETEDGTLYATALTENVVYKIIPLASTPLTLLNFSGLPADRYNELKWVTAMEQHIEKFIIEYSSNGRDFNAAGSVKATNNANGAAYVYRHYGINSSKLFYRLHIIEADGAHHYSPVIALSNNDHAGIKIYPTVVTNGLLHIVSGKKIESIQCFASNGKQVLTRQLKGANGYFSVPLNGLPKGVYIVRLSGRDFHKNQKIMVQ